MLGRRTLLLSTSSLARTLSWVRMIFWVLLIFSQSLREASEWVLSTSLHPSEGSLASVLDSASSHFWRSSTGFFLVSAGTHSTRYSNCESGRFVSLIITQKESISSPKSIFMHKTNSQNRDTLLCQGVTKNLTPCRINIKIFKKYHVKAYDQSFPIMYNTI